jgi:hypothetical protein
MKHKPDGYYWDEDSMAIAELAELARIMEEISEDSPLFFRGTADGQTQPWDRPLVEGFVFKEVTRFLLTAQSASSKRNCWDFGAVQPMQIPNPYSENSLPNLRSEYVKSNVSAAAEPCRTIFNKEPSLHILDGIDINAPAGPNRTVLGLIVIGHPRG